MKKFTVIIFTVFCFAAPALAAEPGEALFKSQGCASCHRPESSSKVNPSLKDIAQMYRGKENQLLQYLNGEAEAIVRPERASMMKRYIEKTKQLDDTGRKSIADFIMTYAD